MNLTLVKLDENSVRSITPERNEEGWFMDKPGIEEVVRYAKPIILKLIGKLAYDLPAEQKEEIEQDAYLRLMKAYDRIDPEMGWKSFAYNHCEGAVMDYMKFGRGFHEDRWSIAKNEGAGSRNATKIRTRLNLIAEDGTELEFDQVLGANGVFSETTFAKLEINWELVSRLASKDKGLHAFAKFLLGMSIEDMAPVFGLCRARIGQLIQDFLDRFDDPHQADRPDFLQICYALGLCSLLGLPVVDQRDVTGVASGWELEPVDLENMTPHPSIKERQAQMSFFDAAENSPVNHEVAV